ncbi:GNAT family N-acetyltransferase [Brasilonema sp. UFV-L1]|nr:GNAT family N-acetyltransferase [Brasilonema sp. UFV-L1]NMG11641.1 GNAT family N-acetyltransferase [Brasilonema sp. UFV-L1]
MHNDLHNEPFGLMEDVFVDENYRGKGYGTQLVKKIIEIAREYRCYKLIATSRSSKPKVHELYQRLGFEEHGVEFRINLL